jgi:hypothetical protein
MAWKARFCVFETQHVFFSISTKFHRNRIIFAPYTPVEWFPRWRRDHPENWQ